MVQNAADVTTIQDIVLDYNSHLHGRRVIYTGEKEITRENVLTVLEKALQVHLVNRREIIFLKNYEKGIQPILLRTKQYNAEINNRVVENLATMITSFKEAEFAGEPIQYVTRKGNGLEEAEDKKNITDLVAQVNDMMLSEDKQTLDFTLAHEMFICGVGYRLTYHDAKVPSPEFLDEAPFEIAIPDTENTFVVKRNDAKKKVLMGVTYVYKDPPNSNVEFTVYTPNVTYTIEGTDTGSALTITEEARHNFGMVSLIEYPCNPDYMGAFEAVIPLLDSINLTLSNRLDGIEQFIQALMVFDGVDIEREDILKLKDLGAIQLPPTPNANGGKKIYYLNEQLDQSQTQTLVNDMKKVVLEIVGMPSQGDASTGDSSNNGAVIMRNGWWHAEGRALQTQNMWKKAETDFLKVVLKICDEANVLTGLKISDLEPRFWRQNYEDLLVKNQSFQVLRAAGMPALQAFKYSHLSKDPEADALIYDDYQQKLAEELKEMNQQAEGLPLNENDTVNPASPEGVEAQANVEEGKVSSSSEGQYAICPVCGKRFLKKEKTQIYDSKSCANKARVNNGVGFRR